MTPRTKNCTTYSMGHQICDISSTFKTVLEMKELRVWELSIIVDGLDKVVANQRGMFTAEVKCIYQATAARILQD